MKTKREKRRRRKVLRHFFSAFSASSAVNGFAWVRGELVFQVRVDPGFDLVTPFIGGVESDGQRLGLAPAYDAFKIDAGQGHQGKRNLDVHPDRKIFHTPDGHAATAYFDAAGADAAAIADEGNLGHHRDTHVAPEFVQ